MLNKHKASHEFLVSLASIFEFTDPPGLLVFAIASVRAPVRDAAGFDGSFLDTLDAVPPIMLYCYEW